MRDALTNQVLSSEEEIAHMAGVAPSTLKSYREARYSRKADSVVHLDAFFTSNS
jgi:hypothetical protein